MVETQHRFFGFVQRILNHHVRALRGKSPQVSRMKRALTRGLPSYKISKSDIFPCKKPSKGQTYNCGNSLVTLEQTNKKLSPRTARNLKLGP